MDISKGLITIAKREYPDAERKVTNMTSFLQSTNQESYDIIIGIASFHHLPSFGLRITTANHIYRSLSYDGLCFLTNRSASDWFNKRFRPSIMKASLKCLVSFGIYKPNDLFLPRKNDKKGETYFRYYHIFSLEELEKIAKLA